MQLIGKIFLTVMVLIAGCASFGGDMIVRVSGVVPEPSAIDRVNQPCRLEIVSIRSGKSGAARDVPTRFSTTIMIVAGPEPEPYYFIAQCGGGARFKSAEVLISSRSSYPRSFDLGVLELEEP